MHRSQALLTLTLLITAVAAGSLDLSAEPGLDDQEPAAAVDGARLFAERCAGCHGAEGRGDGPVAEYLEPRPRDFSTGYFKLGSTQAGDLPSDADLAQIITKRIFWSSMHPYGQFSDQEIAALVARIKQLSGYDDDGTWVNHFAEAGPPRPLELPPPPPKSPGILHLGRDLFRINCAPCHGPEGRGDGIAAKTLRDAWDNPVSPRDFTIPIYKGGADARDIFIRMSRGIPGTPMPSFVDALSARERWAVAYHIVSLQRWPEDLVVQGELMFKAYGCSSCHGSEGRGGVRNPNYAKEEVPALNTVARRLMLFRPPDVETFVDVLRRGDHPAALEEPPRIRRWPAVVAQYDSLRSVIQEGRKAGRGETATEDPPLNMPTWGHVLSDEDVDAILAYLVTLKPQEG